MNKCCDCGKFISNEDIDSDAAKYFNETSYSGHQDIYYQCPKCKEKETDKKFSDKDFYDLKFN